MTTSQRSLSSGATRSALMSRPVLSGRNEDIMALLAGGAHTVDVAARFGLSPQQVCHIARQMGHPLPRGGRDRPSRKTERNLEIAEKYKAGLSMQAVADEYGVTRQLVHQLLTRMKIPRRRYLIE